MDLHDKLVSDALLITVAKEVNLSVTIQLIPKEEIISWVVGVLKNYLLWKPN